MTDGNLFDIFAQVLVTIAVGLIGIAAVFMCAFLALLAWMVLRRTWKEFRSGTWMKERL